MRAKRKTEREGTTYYDNSLVVYGHRVSAYHHTVHGWGWYFDNQWCAPVKEIQPLTDIRKLEAEVLAALPADFVARHKAMDAEYGLPRWYPTT
jgi:hypothetical protein